MKKLLALVLLLIAPLAQAFDCLPKTNVTPTATGSTLRYAKADTGVWVNWWCPVPPAAGQDPTKTWYRQQAWAALLKYENANTNPIEVVYTIGAAADPLAALNTAATAGAIVPAVGSVDEYNYKMLMWSACQALSTTPYDIPDLVPAPCPAQPTPPSPTTAAPVYIAAANGASTTRQAFVATQNTDGSWTRSLTSTGSATVGATCDCQAIKISPFFGSLFCKIDVPGATVPMVTACVLKK